MALFKKSEEQAQTTRERAAPQSRAQTEAISIIASGMRVVGDISTEGTVRVEGEVEGTIRAGKAVVLGQGGRVDGHIVTKEAAIGGQVSGSITASDRLELQKTCSVEGEISTKVEHLKLEEGARFAGQVSMIDEEAEAEIESLTSADDDVEEDEGEEIVAEYNDEDDEVLELVSEEDEAEDVERVDA